MKNNIHINKRGILSINPIWVSLNDGKYKLYFSEKIQIPTTQRENTIKLRDMFFIFSKKVDIKAEKPSSTLNVQISSLDRWLRIGVLIVCFFSIIYLMMRWTFFPIQMLSYILFGYLGFSIILLLILKRKDYFKVQVED